MADLIHTRKTDGATLSAEEIMEKAPAVYAGGQADHLSDRYGKVTTALAIDILADHGFHPVQAAQKAARKASALPYTTHMLAFAPSGPIEGLQERPEIILYNSHDGTSSLRMFAGVYRFICSNGIVAGDGFEARMRHTGGTASKFEEMIDDTARRLPAMQESIEMLRGIAADPFQTRWLAENAAELRWDRLPALRNPEDPYGLFYDDNTIHRMDYARRPEDRSTDAWTVFNRIQESVLRGRVPLRSYTPSSPMGSTRKARPVGSVGGHIDLNRRLWDLAAQTFDVKPSILEAA